MAVIAGVLPAQGRVAATARIAMPAAVASSDHAFTRVESVAELADGSVIVSDIREGLITVLDAELGVTRTVGRRGQGPGEYVNLGAVFHLRGDTAVLVETARRRLRLVTSQTLLGPMRRDEPPPIDLALAGVDSTGRTVEVFASKAGYVAPGTSPVLIIQYAESLVLVRRSREGSARDTIATLAGGYFGVADVERTVRGQRLRYFLQHPIAAADQAVAFPDGWVAVVHGSPYHVQWILPDGSRRRGPPREYRRVRLTTAERQFAIDRRQGPLHQGVFRPEDWPRWPDFLPPFTNGAVLGTGDGHVLVRREMSRADTVQIYDEFDRSGQLVREIVTPRELRVVGAGRRGVYTVRRDDDDLEAILLHPWPPRSR